MLPVVTIVGRPNVGKSTLFNRLTRTQAALVADRPGVTRDRQYGLGRVGEKPYRLIDTGGIQEHEGLDLDWLVEKQVELAIKEADEVIFLVDAQSGVSVADEEIANRLRQLHPRVTLAVNKTDGMQPDIAMVDFHTFGFGKPHAIAASQGRGVTQLIDAVLDKYEVDENDQIVKDRGVSIAVIGCPNVGKSTLINRILGEERVIASHIAGTTRDSIAIPFQHRDQDYTLIDTAGVRRRNKVKDYIEKFSVIKTLKAIEAAEVVIVVFNAREGISDQDLKLVGWVLEVGRPLVLAINQWDDLPEDQKEQVKSDIDRRLGFVDFARRYFISALHGTGVGKLYHAIDEAYAATQQPFSTAQLTKALERAVASHQPPMVGTRRIKLRYLHLGGRFPLTFVVHGKQTDKLPLSYQRYLANFLREYFKIVGVPVHIRLVSDENPYENPHK
ncbi:MAG: ribosome biogenesis GTPase Der [Coxiella sp. RIFCSPHIGHO2_12_FULL_44_14]|nr:MAG: ribosome biogenesis GTPase Der [Coxiella sp. RIFCSPHIGHO2_12_FULL_44_14]